MLKRLSYYLILSLEVLCIVSVPALAQVKGAVVQTWHYEAATNTVTAIIANTSDKGITAFNISLVETFADHSVSTHELLVDMLSAVELVQNVMGTPDEDRIRKQFGDGTLAAHQTRDQVFNYSNGKVLTDFQGTIDVVAYLDGSAEATNTAALERMREHRNADLRSYQKANQIIKDVLADPTIQTPTDEAIKRLQNLLTVWKAQRHSTVDIEPGMIEAVMQDLKNAAAQHLDGETEVLQRYVAEKDRHISMLSKHAQLKAGAAQ